MSIDRIFEALASRPRREILAYLSAQELTAGQIGERFSMSAPAISRHLSVLSAAGLVSSERRGQFVVYRLTPDNMVIRPGLRRHLKAMENGRSGGVHEQQA
ncbi:metalloregulator ArsR/SmtB family transcription factor, partial [Xanthomonas euvesicatoria]|uniref:metalloregulator ArsR/SmtB family transcription factor n=1 Tax=Xanthomonas euvesicatoria TaxID=456327 RepID=UPI001E5B8654